MSPFLFLLPVFAMCLAGSWMSYTDWARRAWWYGPGLVVLGALCTACFAAGARCLDNRTRIFVFSLGYDVLMALAYYVVPVLAFGLKLPSGVAAGAALILAGLILVHASYPSGD